MVRQPAAPLRDLPDVGRRTEIEALLSFGGEPYQLLSHIPGAQACVLVFSTTDRESFQAIDSWREKVEAEVGDIPTVLVQNKIDLLEETVIKKYAPCRCRLLGNQ